MTLRDPDPWTCRHGLCELCGRIGSVLFWEMRKQWLCERCPPRPLFWFLRLRLRPHHRRMSAGRIRSLFKRNEGRVSLGQRPSEQFGKDLHQQRSRELRPDQAEKSVQIARLVAWVPPGPRALGTHGPPHRSSGSGPLPDLGGTLAAASRPDSARKPRDLGRRLRLLRRCLRRPLARDLGRSGAPRERGRR